MRIFLDANIIFSAARSEGTIWKILRMCLDSGHTLCASSYVIEEAQRNLEEKVPGRLTTLRMIVGWADVSTISGPHPLSTDIDLAEKDRHVLAAAISMRCHALLTGDTRHFRHLYGQTIHDVLIVSPAYAAAHFT